MENEVLADRVERLMNSWGEVAVRQQDAVNLLRTVYKEIFGEPVRKNCGDCYYKAFQKIQKFVYLHSNTQNQIEMSKELKERKYLLKRGLVLQVAGGDTLTNDNMTDETAAVVLLKYPNLVKHFDRYPTDADGKLMVEPKVEKKPAKQLPKKEAEPAPELEEVEAPETQEEAPAPEVEISAADPGLKATDTSDAKLDAAPVNKKKK